MKRGHLVIAGGGPVGLVSALMLQPYFERVTVLERHAGALVGGRSLQLVLGERGLHALRCCGLEDEVKAQGIPVTGRVNGATDSFTAYGMEGEAILAVSRVSLQAILEGAVKSTSGIDLLSGATVTHVDRAAESVAFATSEGTESMEYDMLIGADGVRSAVADSLLAPEEVTLDKLPLVYREVPVTAPGWRSDAFVYWSDGEVMVGSFPGRGGKRGLFVMHPRGMETSLFSSGGQGLFDRFPRLSSLGPGLLEQLSQAEAGAMGSKSCKSWTKGNVVIMGDAAHAIVPFMGQGLNTGLEDAVCLMRQFRSAGRSIRGVAPLLKRFERRRKAPADSIRQLSDRHARHLMGASTPVEAAIEERAGLALRSLGLPDTYAACAFSRLRFDRIVGREWRVMDREVQSMSKVA